MHLVQCYWQLWTNLHTLPCVKLFLAFFRFWYFLFFTYSACCDIYPCKKPSRACWLINISYIILSISVSSSLQRQKGPPGPVGPPGDPGPLVGAHYKLITGYDHWMYSLLRYLPFKVIWVHEFHILNVMNWRKQNCFWENGIWGTVWNATNWMYLYVHDSKIHKYYWYVLFFFWFRDHLGFLGNREEKETLEKS